MPRRAEVWLANLNPRRGTEPGKTRPVLVAQAHALIDAGHPSTIVVPMTTNLIDDAEPLRIRVPTQGSLERDSDLLIDQVRAIDNRRLVEGPLAALEQELMGASPRHCEKSSTSRKVAARSRPTSNAGFSCRQRLICETIWCALSLD